MDQLKFVIESSEAESMAKSLGLPSVLHLLPLLVDPAKALARPPISNFRVAAVGLGGDGRIYVGVNLEFPSLPLHHSVHSEQFLLTNLAVHRCPNLVAFAVSDAPCGHCRQFFQELRHSSSVQITVTSSQYSNNTNFKPFSQTLPDPFGPFDLLDKDSPLLLEQHNNGLSLLPASDTPNGFHEFSINNGLAVSNDTPNGFHEIPKINGYSVQKSNGFCELHDEDKNFNVLRVAALEAANNSHAPYSGCPSGVALMDSEGKVYKGSYAESAAYNPSLGPLQAALIAYVAGGRGDYEGIVRAALVEKEGAQVSQEDTARMLLKRVSPKCEFRVFHCSSGENGCAKN